MSLNIKSAELHAIIVESVCRNIKLIEKCQENQSEKTTCITLPEIVHLRLQDCRHLFTIAYASNYTNDNTSKICNIQIVFIYY